MELCFNREQVGTNMSITTPITKLLGINHPILLAPMDLVADGRLVAAVDAAGGFGILGGGYGDEKWLARELDVLERAKGRFGVGFITWSMAKQPKVLDLALERKPVAVMLSFGSPVPFIDRIKRTGALVICQVQAAARGSDYAGPRNCGFGGSAHTGCGCRRNCRRSRAGSGPHAGSRRRDDGHTLLCLTGGGRKAGS